MFYVSSIQPNGLIGVTDTDDNVEEFYTSRKLAEIIKDSRKRLDEVHVFGCQLWNNDAECQVIKLGQTLDVDTLKALISKWRGCHNPWEEFGVECYLAGAKVGTVIVVAYDCTDTSGRVSHCDTRLVRTSISDWYFEDSSNTMSGKYSDSRFATWALDVCCVGCKVRKIAIFE